MDYLKMNKLSPIALAWELYKKHTPSVNISEILDTHRETIEIWISRIKRNPKGIIGFLDEYLNSKKGKRRKRKNRWTS